MTAPLDLAAWRALTDAATEGPWRRDLNAVRSPDGHAIALTYPAHGGEGSYRAHRHDAEFIAAARTALPALLDAIGRVLALCWAADHEQLSLRPDQVRRALGVEADPNG